MLICAALLSATGRFRRSRLSFAAEPIIAVNEAQAQAKSRRHCAALRGARRGEAQWAAVARGAVAESGGVESKQAIVLA